LFSTFPGAWPGAGLLVLRLTAGSVSIVEGATYLAERNGPTLSGALIGMGAIAAGSSLLVGFLTPAAGILVAVGSGCIALSVLAAPSWHVLGDEFAAALLTAVGIAVVLLGPGAFSVDSYLFGRREIVIRGERPRGVSPR
jgi:uncharacterized membrane protein YphA (DoxX/SURF4 family)